MAYRPRTNIWDQYRKVKLIRYQKEHRPGDYVLDPGVNYFVLMLERLGCKTHFSCEGHPRGFYITFTGPFKIAKRISRCCWDTLDVLLHNTRNTRWIIRLRPRPGSPIRCRCERNIYLRRVAEQWERSLGPLQPTQHLKGRP